MIGGKDINSINKLLILKKTPTFFCERYPCDIYQMQNAA